MDIGVYYQILDIGIQYEKGRKRGSYWKLGERKYLQEEVDFWRKLLEYIANELNEIDCSEQIFEEVQRLCRDYKFPNYEQILKNKDKLNDTMIIDCNFKTNEQNIRNIMDRLLQDMIQLLSYFNGKEEFYQLLNVLHNLPKSMHGKGILCNHPKLVSYNDALKYAYNCLSTHTLQEKYGKLFLI